MYRLLTICLLALPLAVAGDDFVAEASVISSKPITTTRLTDAMPPACLAGRPATDSIQKILEWDVGCELNREVEVTEYRVLYRFQGETFAMMADKPPGKTIPIRITLN